MTTSNGSARGAPDKQFDQEAEYGVIASILIHPNLVWPTVKPMLSAHKFANEACRYCWQAIERTTASGSALDAITLADALREIPVGDRSAFEYVGYAQLGEILESQVTATHAKYYASIVAKWHQKRELAHFVDSLQRSIVEGVSNAEIRWRIKEFADLESETSDVELLPMISGDELFQQDWRVDFHVEGICAKLQPALLAGPMKGLKTSIMLDLVISLVFGGCFLGRFRVHTPHRVMVYSAESGTQVIAATARAIALAANIDLAGAQTTLAERLCICSQVPRLGEPRYEGALRQRLAEFRPDIVIFDPAYRMMPKSDQANLYSQGDLLAGVCDLCLEHAATPIVLHHLKKTLSDFSPPELADVNAAGFGEYFRQWLILGRREKYMPGEPHRMHLTVGSSVGHASRWCLDIEFPPPDESGHRTWAVEVSSPTAADEARQQRRVSKLASSKERRLLEHRQSLLDALKEYPEGETAKRLRESAGLNNGNFSVAVTTLLAEGRVEICTVRKGKAKYEGYRPMQC